MKPVKSKTGKVYDLAWVLSNCVERGSCWVWNRSSSDGYGHFVVKRPERPSKSYRTHRYVYCLVYGKPDKGNVVRHKCHNRLCCNPIHLEQGTHRDNWLDSEHTHRQATYERTCKKVRAVNATLSDKEVRRYRKRFCLGKCSVSELSVETGLSKTTVLSLLKGETYKRDTTYVKRCRRLIGTSTSKLKLEVDKTTIARIKKLRNKGLSDYAISDLVSLSRAKVQRTRSEHGIA
jgi:hypothetical protein